jgi:hypothetical protein
MKYTFNQVAWTCHVYEDGPGGKLLRTFKAVPECGEDFCDACGDCLLCYGGDPCPSGTHWWVAYDGEDADRIERERITSQQGWEDYHTKPLTEERER